MPLLEVSATGIEQQINGRHRSGDDEDEEKAPQKQTDLTD